MEASQCLKFFIKCIDKPSRKSKKRFNGRLWEINGGIYPDLVYINDHTVYCGVLCVHRSM